MKDERGLYYHPYPQNPKTRMYVRQQPDDIYFRLWSSEDADLWNEHQWVPYGAIRKATAMYKKSSDFDPTQAYDINVARALLEEEGT